MSTPAWGLLAWDLGSTSLCGIPAGTSAARRPAAATSSKRLASCASVGTGIVVVLRSAAAKAWLG
jgi:hypothetical protein